MVDSLTVATIIMLYLYAILTYLNQTYYSSHFRGPLKLSSKCKKHNPHTHSLKNLISPTLYHTRELQKCNFNSSTPMKYFLEIRDHFLRYQSMKIKMKL